MTETQSHDHDATRPETSESSDGPAERLTPEECHETVDPETRATVLSDYGHRCQVCGRYGPQKGGLATLHVHHIERDPDGMDEHDLENLTLLCRSCHSWFHQKATPDDAPVEITEADQTVLLPQDIEILRYVADHGPARTGDIVAGLPSDHSVSAVRERLWVLMGLDNLVETRDRQIVDKDVETGEWGLVEQIENSARGHIPDDPQLLLQRMEDEQVRQALDRGCDRSNIIDVLNVSRRTTFNKHKRACAYDFPLSAFSRGGRPTEQSKPGQDGSTSAGDAGEDAGQQRLDSVADPGADGRGQTETWGRPESPPDSLSTGADEVQASDVRNEDDELRARLEDALTTLQEVSETL